MLILLILLPFYGVNAQQYQVVTYNVENLFDADGVAAFDEYKALSSAGEPNYTPLHVYTKVKNAVSILMKTGNNEAPDILMLVEMESDHTPAAASNNPDYRSLLRQYEHVTLYEMLTSGFSDEIADLPAEFLLLKGFWDEGVRDYDVAVAYERDANGIPVHVQKNVLFSRLTILHEKTKSHPTENARPILEAWIDVDGHELAVFVNHWKSGASDTRQEAVRIQNAGVLKHRLDEIREENPSVDFILGGDFNSDYNQSQRYTAMQTTGLNTVLRSVGDERAVMAGSPDWVYNLWYELPAEQRGSDTYRGNWGTLMHMMIGSGMYDNEGISYVDNSFSVGKFEGFNAYSNSGAPIRWSSFGNGYGFSDHFPISMYITTQPLSASGEPGFFGEEDTEAVVVPLSYSLPSEGMLLKPSEYPNQSMKSEKFYDKLFLIEAVADEEGSITLNNETFALYAPGFNLKEKLKDSIATGKMVRFIGRLNTFRGNWQFVVESEKYILER